MRPIEFRAWNKYHNKMYPVYMLNFESDLVYCKGDDYSWHTFLKIDCEVMQFTGLHDRNGVKVFEGDILADPDIYPQSYDNGDYAYSIIEFVGGKFCISYKPLINHFDDIADANDLIIVGNIHQNPELFEQ